jgi:CheY-like chemotaxis protein
MSEPGLSARHGGRNLLDLVDGLLGARSNLVAHVLRRINDSVGRVRDFILHLTRHIQSPRKMGFDKRMSLALFVLNDSAPVFHLAARSSVPRRYRSCPGGAWDPARRQARLRATARSVHPVILAGQTATGFPSSVLGQGSEFVVRLPVVSPPEPQPSLPPIEKAQPTGRSLRVLVVDDNVDTVTTLAMLVKESGRDVRTAYDGSAVLEAALDYRPNVVLLDIGLPGLNGFEVAKQLRHQPTLKNVVLVAMTGYGQESDRKRSKEAGFDQHLVKPGDFGKVLQMLATVSESLPR